MLNWGLKSGCGSLRGGIDAGFARVDAYADWTRGEVICRLTTGREPFSLFPFAPKHGKASRMLN